MDLAAERRNGDFVRGLIRSGRIRVCHDLSDGGLLAAAAEMALASNVGVELNATSDLHAHAYLFGEDQGRYLIACPADEAEELLAEAQAAGVHAIRAGVAGGDGFGSGGVFEVSLAALRDANEGWLPRFMA